MPKDWTKLYRNYKGKWVALAKDEMTVLASGKTAREAFDKAKAKHKNKRPILTRMPKTLDTYVGYDYLYYRS